MKSTLFDLIDQSIGIPEKKSFILTILGLQNALFYEKMISKFLKKTSRYFRIIFCIKAWFYLDGTLVDSLSEAASDDDEAG